MDTSFLGIPWLVWGLGSLVVAAIFLVVWPKRSSAGLSYVILRWGHAAVWILLALSFFLRSLPDIAGAANIVALLALGTYLIFLMTLVRTRK